MLARYLSLKEEIRYGQNVRTERQETVLADQVKIKLRMRKLDRRLNACTTAGADEAIFRLLNGITSMTVPTWVDRDLALFSR